MAEGNADLGEKALSKVVEVGLSSQLDHAEAMDVDIRTDPGKLMQGNVDSVAIVGKGLVMKRDLRLETLEINTDQVSINPLHAVLGNVELTHPTNAEARFVLLESDMNRAFSSDYIRAKLRGLKMQLEGKPVTMSVEKAEIELPGDNQIIVNADFLLLEPGENKKLVATAVPRVEEDGQCIVLEILSAEGQDVTQELITAIFEQVTHLLDLRNFDLSGTSMKLQTLEAQKDKLVIHALTEIVQIPSV
ncbi:MAG: DUF2993 domain-containing protein [Stenomitos rutilans HA7619-LM2]|jgi:hypothetical protein|nr:DUF2993 domain-containing protein [Stenomitos rutilans HA7619-LM2]